ncbi:16S rRNA (adenine(1518)-N(6)/adenine(1519)-N(6))-dimethyltransferase RsmA [Pelolinea submarina]|uniref:Ribosomal RNA small subunit methyltransferase A n=1 Tax=Pelolinea submarina TaxID=913107 RepID=A0A347ZQH7_9CHLR|nr:16S rRNA (adenine(1518)-N(6)/adenine(1519)-N(6))-dimethyltransferase RsmA [Pelolinea submarina]REG06112.1 16S rRNA (adenine1518-N6/adenine1519-N6)-dimethyltransferase [Pelolinea submarina]BBB47558.1 16S rRNA (adenine1518-N6/adenine1519-N6)-dimethyltransferase [Pelolinea submarina]
MTLSPLPVPSMLKDYGLQPKKGLGQNFLVDDTYLQRIVEAAGVTSADEVLEIGAGLGSLTRYLADAAGQVCAVEIDSRFTPVLKKVLKEFPNVNLVNADIMDTDVGQWMHQPGYLVVANIPYYITSALIRHLLEAEVKPGRIALTIQKEVAQRVCAKPGDLSLLALSVQVFGAPRVAFNIAAGAFYPAPKVDSALLLVDLYERPLIANENMKTFFGLAKSAFAKKRKMLHNALSSHAGLGGEGAGLLLEAAGISSDRRAQTLSLEEWGSLTEAYLKLPK